MHSSCPKSKRLVKCPTSINQVPKDQYLGLSIYRNRQTTGKLTDMQTRSSWICLLHACMLYPGLKYIHIHSNHKTCPLCVCVQFLQDTGEFQQAEEVLNKVVQVEPDNPLGYFSLGLVTTPSPYCLHRNFSTSQKVSVGKCVVRIYREHGTRSTSPAHCPQYMCIPCVYSAELLCPFTL